MPYKNDDYYKNYNKKRKKIGFDAYIGADYNKIVAKAKQEGLSITAFAKKAIYAAAGIDAAESKTETPKED